MTALRWLSLALGVALSTANLTARAATRLGPEEAEALSTNRIAMLEAVYGADAVLELAPEGVSNVASRRLRLADIARFDKHSDLTGTSRPGWEPEDLVLTTAGKTAGVRYHLNRLVGPDGFVHRLSNVLDRLEQTDVRAWERLSVPDRHGEAGGATARRRVRLALTDAIASVTVEPQAYRAVPAADPTQPPQLVSESGTLSGSELLLKSSRIADATAVDGELYVRPEGSRFFFRARDIGPWLGARVHYDDLTRDLEATYAQPDLRPSETATYAHSGLARQGQVAKPTPQTRLGPYALVDLIEIIKVLPDGTRASAIPLAAVENIQRKPDGGYVGDFNGQLWTGWFSAEHMIARVGTHEIPFPLEPGQTWDMAEIAGWALRTTEQDTGKSEQMLLGEYEAKVRRLAERHQELLAGLHFYRRFSTFALDGVREVSWDASEGEWNVIAGVSKSRRAGTMKESLMGLIRARPRDDIERPNDLKGSDQRGSHIYEGTLGDEVEIPRPGAPVSGADDLHPVLPIEVLFGMWIHRGHILQNYGLDMDPAAIARSRSIAARWRIGALGESDRLFFSGPVAGGGQHEPLSVDMTDVADVYHRGGFWHVQLREGGKTYAFRSLRQEGQEVPVSEPRLALTTEEIEAEGPAESDRFERLQFLRTHKIPHPREGDISGTLVGAEPGQLTRLSSVHLTDAVFDQATQDWHLTTEAGRHQFQKDGFVLGSAGPARGAYAAPAARSLPADSGAGERRARPLLPGLRGRR